MHRASRWWLYLPLTMGMAQLRIVRTRGRAVGVAAVSGFSTIAFLFVLQVVTLYGRHLELFRRVHDSELVLEEEDARREEGGEDGSKMAPGPRSWEADFLDAFSCGARVTVDEEVRGEELHALGVESEPPFSSRA